MVMWIVDVAGVQRVEAVGVNWERQGCDYPASKKQFVFMWKGDTVLAQRTGVNDVT